MDFSLEPLEYDRFKALLGRYIQSPAARELLDALTPTTDRERLEKRHQLGQEAMEYLRDQTIRFPHIAGLDSVLARLGPGGITLEIPEIEAVQEFVGEVVGLRAKWGSEARDFPLLARRFQALPDLSPLRRYLARAIRAGEIREEFSPELRRLRRDLETSRGRLIQKLRAIVKRSERSGRLQEAIITVRNGRFVIPVRAEQERNVAGVVHGSSSSGATVFMEPLETLDMNNDLVRISEDEEREIRRILGELTDQIQDKADDLNAAAAVRTDLEVVFGIARWGREFECTTPRFSEGEVYLRSARHPLLEDRLRRSGEAVVPLSLDMPSDERVLVISGPNAGGKTVVLKTLGLFSLMAQSGVPVPASDASLPLTDRVLADIGDQQSIANQLSTFSAHVLSVSRMVEAATADSLILLDEVGSSTEPAEGAALGIAVLEHFRSVGSRTVATTHYNRLKMYAETTNGVRNAAMEFNEETLEPTFALIQGLAGQSSGLRIAERLNLRKDLLELAWSRLDSSELDAARFVERLKRRIRELEAEKSKLEAERRKFDEWKKRMKARMESERSCRLKDLEMRLDGLVADIRRRAEDSLRSAGPKGVRRFEKALERAHLDARNTLEREVIGEDRSPRRAVTHSGGTVSPLVVGSRVRVLSLGVEGIILELTDAVAHVSVGQMKVQRPLEDLEALSAPSVRLPDHVQFSPAPEEGRSSEINVIGLSRDEAVDRLDKFLDDAFLTGFPSVRVIHGSGKGILRDAVASFLETHPHVSGYELAPPEQGGGGVTIVEMRE